MHFLCYINSKKDHKVDWNHDTEAKLGNLTNSQFWIEKTLPDQKRAEIWILNWGPIFYYVL